MQSLMLREAWVLGEQTRLYRLATGDSPGLGQSGGRTIPTRRCEASPGVEGPLGESRGLSTEANAVFWGDGRASHYISSAESMTSTISRTTALKSRTV